MKIIAHTVIKNEENFIWYAVNSVIDYVDEIMIWDQGSIDNTVSIIKEIKNPKVKFRQALGEVSQIREQMLKETEGDWIVVLDGDEIWWEEGIKRLISNIKNTQCDLVVAPNYMLIGDMFHYQEERAGKYQIAGRVGHYNIKAIKKDIEGLHVEGTYPNEAYVTGEGVKLQNLPDEKTSFLKEKYLHASFLERSSKDIKKIKYEIGEEFSKDFYYPEVFFKECPKIVSSIWKSPSLNYEANAFWQTPLKKIKRRII